METINNCDHGVSLDLRGASPSFNPHVMFLSADSSTSASSVIDKNNDDRFGLILTEVLRLRTQVSSLQAQIAAITHERDSASMLIWTEVSRLAQQLEHMDGLRGDNKNNLDLSLPHDNVSPPESIVGTQEIKFTDPVIIRTLLGDSSGCLPHKSGLETNESSISLSSNEASQSDDRGASDVRLKHIKKRSRNSLDDCDMPKRVSHMGRQNSLGELASNDLLCSVEHTNGEGNKTKSSGSTEATSEQLIHQWIEKQRVGERERPELGVYKSGELESEWWCHVCGTMARDGPPGEHFCWSKIDNNSRDGLKVFCHYCKKGTSRMPDLRVHFKKIVYCKLLRRELTRQYLGLEDGTDYTHEESLETKN